MIIAIILVIMIWWRSLLFSEPVPCSRCLLGRTIFEFGDFLMTVLCHCFFCDFYGALLGVLNFRFAKIEILLYPSVSDDYHFPDAFYDVLLPPRDVESPFSDSSFPDAP